MENTRKQNKKQEKFNLGDLIEATFDMYHRPKIYLGKNKFSSQGEYGLAGKCITVYDMDTHKYFHFEHENYYRVYLG